jgi:hypothetical protein
MLTVHLHKEGFFPISWADTTTPGTTYVRPTAKGVVRVFVPAQHNELQLYMGSLQAGQLRYCGPVPGAVELRQLLADACGTPAASEPLSSPGLQPMQ